MNTAGVIKLGFCLLQTAVAVAGLVLARRRAREGAWLVRASFAFLALQAVAAVAVYTWFPHAVRFSDAVAFYLPETRALLQGRLPYNGFVTSYSPFFHVLLAPVVAVWPSAGGIALLMQGAEALLVAGLVAALRAEGRERDAGLTAWLIVSSPLQVYWVGVGGYNSILLAAAAGLAVVLARRGRHVAAGIVGALGLLACKALGVIAWPTIVLADRAGRRRRLAVLGGAVVLLALLGVAGLDVLMPARREAGRWAGGNAFVALAAFLPGVYRATAATAASYALTLAAFALGTVRYARGRRADLDAALAHLGWMTATFLILSVKSMTMYLPMLAPFAAHVLATRGDGRLRALVPYLGLGVLATTGIESRWLTDMITSRHLVTTGSGALVLAAELLRLACLAAIAGSCWRALGPGPARAGTPEAPASF